MTKTNTQNTQETLSESKELIQHTDSTGTLSGLKEVKLQSTNLIYDTAMHLNGSMKALTKNLHNTDINQMDVEKAQTACLIAKQIIELMKVQVEAMRIVK